MIKKIIWVFLEKGASTIIQFVSLIILGRLLSPNDYGTYGIMMVFITLSDTLVDSGFGGALVNKKNINQQDINTLFVTNAIISLILYVFIFISAPYIERFYQIENLSVYFRTIGLVVIIYAMSIVQNALILRELKFKLSAIINVVSSIISTLVAILLAYYGLGVWALIAQILLQSTISTTILWLLNSVKIRFSFSKQSFSFFWNFGSNLLGANILQTIANNISNSVIPKIGSLKDSGLYFQANKLTNVPVNILALSIDKGFFPILSQTSDIKIIAQKARQLCRIIVTITAPIFPLMSICSLSIIKLVVGDQWLGSSVFFSILLWGVFPLVWQSICRNIIKSTGETGYILKIEIFKSVIMLLIVLLSLFFGVIFLTVGFTVAAYIGAIIWSICLKSKINIDFISQVEDIKKPLVATLISYVLMSIVFNSSNSMFALLSLPIGYIIYIIVNVILKNQVIYDCYKWIK